MTVRANKYLFAASLLCLIVGIVLSHLVESSVRVKHITVAGNIPALQFSPTAPGPHPVALLAHGIFCSKEMVFRYAEALAAAGFECTSVDMPGHGAAPGRLTIANNTAQLGNAARALDTVDVFFGHSMGAYAGADTARETALHPKLFISAGALPYLGNNPPPLLLLAGQFEVFLSVAEFKARTDAQKVLSPHSDHLLELYDPLLVNAAVDPACSTVNKTPPPPPTRWHWRLLGLILGQLSAFGLGKLALHLSDFAPQWAWFRAPLFSILVLSAFALTTTTWLGAVPHLRRLPLQIAAIAILWLLVTGMTKLRIPRWTLLPLAAVAFIGCIVARSPIGALFAAFFVIIFSPATTFAALAARPGPQRDSNLIFAIFAGYAIGQWIPILF